MQPGSPSSLLAHLVQSGSPTPTTRRLQRLLPVRVAGYASDRAVSQSEHLGELQLYGYSARFTTTPLAYHRDHSIFKVNQLNCFKLSVACIEGTEPFLHKGRDFLPARIGAQPWDAHRRQSSTFWDPTSQR
jgi:hypothetical protein